MILLDGFNDDAHFIKQARKLTISEKANYNAFVRTAKSHAQVRPLRSYSNPKSDAEPDS